MERLDMTDLRVIMILTYKDEMIEKGIIPEDVKWDKLTQEQQDKVVEFITNKVENKKKEFSSIMNNCLFRGEENERISD